MRCLAAEALDLPGGDLESGAGYLRPTRSRRGDPPGPSPALRRPKIRWRWDGCRASAWSGTASPYCCCMRSEMRRRTARAARVAAYEMLAAERAARTGALGPAGGARDARSVRSPTSGPWASSASPRPWAAGGGEPARCFVSRPPGEHPFRFPGCGSGSAYRRRGPRPVRSEGGTDKSGRACIRSVGSEALQESLAAGTACPSVAHRCRRIGAALVWGKLADVLRGVAARAALGHPPRNLGRRLRPLAQMLHRWCSPSRSGPGDGPDRSRPRERLLSRRPHGLGGAQQPRRPRAGRTADLPGRHPQTIEPEERNTMSCRRSTSCR